MTVEEIGTEIPPGAIAIHEPHGFVRLESCLASDLMVVNAARVSFRKRSDWEWDEGQITIDDPKIQEMADSLGPVHTNPHLSETDEKVLRFLMKNKHGTPFETNLFVFHVRAPIFVFREWHRHRIGISINEESARYVPLQPHFYLPDDEHVRVQRGKPGAYTFEPCGDQPVAREADAKWDERVTYGEVTRDTLDKAYSQAYKAYEYLMAIGVAKEIARACLPVGIYSQMYWSVNARSLMNFLALRNAPNALREIRDYADAMEKLFAQVMPVTFSAFVENGRVAP